MNEAQCDTYRNFINCKILKPRGYMTLRHTEMPFCSQRRKYITLTSCYSYGECLLLLFCHKKSLMYNGQNLYLPCPISYELFYVDHSRTTKKAHSHVDGYKVHCQRDINLRGEYAVKILLYAWNISINFIRNSKKPFNHSPNMPVNYSLNSNVDFSFSHFMYQCHHFTLLCLTDIGKIIKRFSLPSHNGRTFFWLVIV